jgi:transcriptional regulator with XRE-family HTH domain
MLDRMRRIEAIQRHLADNLKAARVRAELSQEKLALDAGVDRTYVSQIERGVGNPSIGVLHRLATRLSLDLVELLSISDASRARGKKAASP